MAAGEIVSFVHKNDSFSHTDACRIFDLAVRTRGAKTVVIDLKHAVIQLPEGRSLLHDPISTPPEGVPACAQ